MEDPTLSNFVMATKSYNISFLWPNNHTIYHTSHDELALSVQEQNLIFKKPLNLECFNIFNRNQSIFVPVEPKPTPSIHLLFLILVSCCLVEYCILLMSDCWLLKL